MENYNGLEFGFNNKEGIKNNVDDGYEKINDKEPLRDIKKRFKFYYTEKSTKNNLILSEKEKMDAENEILNYRKVTPEFKKENLKTPEFKKRIDILRERIIDFGKERGLDFSERLVSNEDIYLFMENKYKRLAPKNTAGIQDANEILINQEFSSMDCLDKLLKILMEENNEEKDAKKFSYNVQHELLHSACIKRIIVKKDNEFLSRIFHRERNIEETVSGGYASSSGKLRIFNESLIEITNVQIYLNNNEDYNISDINYIRGVIFVTEMINDMAKKTNIQRDEILTEFQKGMFEGKRAKLKIIKDLYGEEAINKLVNMKGDKKSILGAATTFGIIDNVKKQIERMETGKQCYLSIGNKIVNARISEKY